MAKQKVLLLGATGETGGDILNGLLEDGNLDVTLLIRPSSAEKPAVKSFSSRGLNIVHADPAGDFDTLTNALAGFDTVISAIDFGSQLVQLALVDAAAKAGVQRMVPCGFITVCPPSGVMKLRDEKEEVYARMWYHKLPYTIIDVGYWHQISFFSVPSGKFDYAQLLPRNEIVGKGDVKTLLTDKRDIGRFVANIIQDPRTLNQKVFTWSDEFSQTEVLNLIEAKTGEKVEVKQVSEFDIRKSLAQAQALLAADPKSMSGLIGRSTCEYRISKFIRGDNTRQNGKYLGYLDARELYPEFVPISFENFLEELIAGEVEMPYSTTIAASVKKQQADE